MKPLPSTPLYEFLNDFQTLTEPAFLLQLGWLGLAIALGWGLSRLLRPRLNQSQGLGRWRLGSQGMVRVLSPLLCWLTVELVIIGWRQQHSVSLLTLAASLLSAMVLVQVAVYLFNETFIQGNWSRQRQRTVAMLIWAGFALYITGVWPEIRVVLESIAFPLGRQRISLLLILQGLLSVATTLLLAMWLGRQLEKRVMAAQSLDLSLRVVFTKIVRTALMVLAVLVALPLVGIDLTVLSVFGGALGVGLGFGLQKIASNYVSGFIILLDRSVRIGDLVNVSDRQGIISAITARYVVLKATDGTEAIIPNETLITSTVLNLSFSDKTLRLALPVQIAYGSDIEQAMALLLAVTEGEDRILAEPAPQVFLRGFAESGIDLELGLWVKDADQGTLGLRSALNLKIWRSFAAHGIEMPCPRRDVRVLSGTAEMGADRN
ncbi:mechanosensitive ion channel family protein [Chitinimonas lacunae]|uniref:Mechanosensitive ion channel family protein n=1 Tax=Chitinimonas lacunae TaxID=1963018 RepID=A0ABV8MVY5_9NEIS